MPKGPKGQKRPADVIGTAVKVARIATGEIGDEQPDDGKDKAAQALGRKGGKARASTRHTWQGKATQRNARNRKRHLAIRRGFSLSQIKLTLL